MSSTKSSYFMFFGIIFGLCLGLVIRNHRALELLRRCDSRAGDRHPYDIIRMHPNDTVHNSQQNLLFVGVMTAKNFLRGRAKAVYDTWGKEVPGRIAFFSSEGSRSADLPVIALSGVDDRYPPQKKSFMMLYYMYEHFIDRFEWFARTDDDVYINTAKLERLLRSVDSSKPQFIGQAGKGNSEEFGLLSLEFDENFCMGGPGVILSRETLKRVAPHIPTCLRNLYSTHEDVEIGRCVQKFAGIPCTWNYEMQSILRHNSSGKFAFTGSLKSKEIHNAITLHPVKMAPLMYRLHAYMQGLRAQELRQQSLQLHRDIAAMKELLAAPVKAAAEAEAGKAVEEQAAAAVASPDALVSGVPIFPAGPESDWYLGDHSVLGKQPNLKKHTPSHLGDLQHWQFIARSLYAADSSNPKRKIDSALREGLDDVITEVMDNINNFSRQRGRVIEFRELLYGYSRLNALYGHDLVLDLLLIYKKYRGKKMTVPVRRHLYIQRAFTDVFVRETTSSWWYDVPAEAAGQLTVDPGDGGAGGDAGGDGEGGGDAGDLDQMARLSARVSALWNTGVGKISDLARAIDSPQSMAAVEPTMAVGAADKKIVFILSLAGRFATFVRFLRNYREVCLDSSSSSSQGTDLLVVFFDDGRSEMAPFYAELDALSRFHPTAAINRITLHGDFSRGKALDAAARSQYASDGDILFFVDVDITFTAEALDRVRLHTVRRRQVYLPIVFSEYAPQGAEDAGSSPGSDTSPVGQPADLDEERGYFRQFGYGICAIYRADVMHASLNGFNTEISGWGLEDVRFLEQIVKLQQQPHLVLLNMVENGTQQAQAAATNATTGGETGGAAGTTAREQPTHPAPANGEAPLRLDVFRASDPSLVHRYHPIECDRGLDEAQYKMCVGTKANTLGSYAWVEEQLLANEEIVRHFRELNGS